MVERLVAARPGQTGRATLRRHPRPDRGPTVVVVLSRSLVSPKPEVRQFGLPIVRSTLQRSFTVRTPSHQVLEKPGYNWGNRRSNPWGRRHP